MGNLSHDKVERAGLGRVVEVMASNNRNYKLDASWHDGMISVRIDEDGVDSNDNYIATKIIYLKKLLITLETDTK